MKSPTIAPSRVKKLLAAARRLRILVVGDLMLDQFIWGSVSRISPEAPVPVVDFLSESYIPGGGANVARNLSALGARTEIFGLVGNDPPASQLRELLATQKVDCRGVVSHSTRPTIIKTRIVANQQQVVRLDRETRGPIDASSTRRLLVALQPRVIAADAVIIADYGKGLVTQALLDDLKQLCRARGVWLSLDPKPIHPLNLRGMSLITPNRKEAFELAGISDTTRSATPLQDIQLIRAARKLLDELRPALLLITLGELGMLLCTQRDSPFHIPTVAQEIFDVSGAGDTVIASFTLAVAAGASPAEAAVLSNHAAGVVVGKMGTATVSPEELLASFRQ